MTWLQPCLQVSGESVQFLENYNSVGPLVGAAESDDDLTPVAREADRAYAAV
jgi:hypothetical protein